MINGIQISIQAAIDGKHIVADVPLAVRIADDGVYRITDDDEYRIID
jgi:hypothetical protein